MSVFTLGDLSFFFLLFFVNFSRDYTVVKCVLECLETVNNWLTCCLMDSDITELQGRGGSGGREPCY